MVSFFFSGEEGENVCIQVAGIFWRLKAVQSLILWLLGDSGGASLGSERLSLD